MECDDPQHEVLHQFNLKELQQITVIDNVMVRLVTTSHSSITSICNTNMYMASADNMKNAIYNSNPVILLAFGFFS